MIEVSGQAARIADAAEPSPLVGHGEAGWRSRRSGEPELSAGFKAGRLFSRFFLRPLQHLWNLIFYIYGFGFLAVFCLGLMRTPELEAAWLIAILIQTTAPLLIWAGQLLAALGVASPDAYKALPLLLSVLTWLLRPWGLTRLKGIRARLEHPPADFFGPGKGQRAPSPWGQSQAYPSSVQDSEFGPVESEARLVKTGPLPTIACRYELLEEIGRGPVGAVYKALDLQIGRFVAVKMIFPGGLSPEQLQQQKERIYREARTAGKMAHPGIATILDLDEDENGAPFIVMEYAECRGLDQALPSATEPPTLKERLNVAIEIARALDFAHRRGVVHRDIKPSNILITADGHAKIGDFGIAKPMDRNVSEVPGTPAFVAPELLDGATASARTDIFSLGVVLYWLFTGKMPFTGRSLTEVVYNVATVDPPPARQLNWALPADLEPILQRCLAKKPAERYQTVGELTAELVALRRSRRKSHAAQKPANRPMNDTATRPQSRRAAS